MTDRTNRPPSEVLGALPRSRPHRRSAKRATPAGASADPPRSERATSAAPAAPESAAAERGKPAPASRGASPKRSRPVRAAGPARRQRLRQPPQPRGLPPTPPEGHERPAPEESHDLLGGTVRAAAELTEIGLTTSARMLRAAVSWLPRR